MKAAANSSPSLRSPMLAILILLTLTSFVATRPSTADADDLVRVFLPNVSLRPAEPLAPQIEFEERAFLGGATASLASQGDSVYLATGNAVATYDVSSPGDAQRIGTSAEVDGRIFRMEAGEDLLFVLSRWTGSPEARWLANESLEIEPPPWNVLTIFDLSEPSRPALVSEVRFDNPMLFAIDIAAKGKHAYLLMAESSDPIVFEKEDQGTGLWIVDASDAEAPSVVEFIEEGVFECYRMTIEGDRLHLFATAFPMDLFPREDEFYAGVASLDVADPGTPRIVAFTGAREFDHLIFPFTLSAHQDRVYRIAEMGTGYLLTTEFDANGEARLIGVDEAKVSGRPLDEVVPSLESLGIEDAWHAVAGPDRLFVFELERTPPRVSAIDMKDPLAPRVLGQTDLEPEDMWIDLIHRELLNLIGDLGSDMILVEDRLFIATGDEGTMIEADVSGDGVPKISAIYAEFAGARCAAEHNGKLFIHHSRSDVLSINTIDPEDRLPELARAPLSHRLDCEIALSTNYAFAADADGIRVFEHSANTRLEDLGSIVFDGRIQGIHASDQRLFVLSKEMGLFSYDVSDPTSPVLDWQLRVAGESNAFFVDQTMLHLSNGSGLDTYQLNGSVLPSQIAHLDLGGQVYDIEQHEGQLFLGVLTPAGDAGSTERISSLVTTSSGRSPVELARLRVKDLSVRTLTIDPVSDRLYAGRETTVEAFDISSPVPQAIGRHFLPDYPYHLLVADDLLFVTTDFVGTSVLQVH